MGCFSKGKGYEAPPAQKVPTIEELMQGAIKTGQETMPLAYGAREKALGYLSTPETTQSYYSGFQPTSFEEALSNQYFQNVWPDTEAKIRQALSLSGMAYSPQLAATTGREYGNLSTQIGQYLSDLGNQRAQYNLSNMLGIDPMSQILMPTAGLGAQQGNLQAQLNYQAALDQARAAVQQSKGSGITSLLGAGLGALLALPTGGMSVLAGAGLGGMLGGMGGEAMGYGASPMDFSTALTLGGLQGFSGMGGGVGKNVGTALNVNPTISSPTSLMNAFPSGGFGWGGGF